MPHVVAALEPSLAFRFVRTRLDRRADLRDDAAAIAALWRAETARVLVLHGGRVVVASAADGATTATHDTATAARLGGDVTAPLFLGLEAGDGRFAVASASDDETLPEGFAAIDLRALAVSGALPAEDYGTLATARALMHWHDGHRFCARCGTASEMVSAGWKRLCPSCGAEHFPRTDPVVIMSVEDGERCLLGRSARFPPGMWSCLAGFMEPGETIEGAVRRETAEEAGIVVGAVAYVASEPWPFPGSLMIGARARAITTEIRRDPVELEDCRWFDRAEVRAMLEGRHPDGLFLPPPIAIAHHLVTAFARAATDR